MGVPPVIIYFNGIFHHKPSIWGYPHSHGNPHIFTDGPVPRHLNCFVLQVSREVRHHMPKILCFQQIKSSKKQSFSRKNLKFQEKLVEVDLKVLQDDLRSLNREITSQLSKNWGACIFFSYDASLGQQTPQLGKITAANPLASGCANIGAWVVGHRSDSNPNSVCAD